MPEHVDVKRILLWSLLGLTILVASFVSVVGVRVADVEPLPPPDSGLLIQLGDGSRLPLAEVVQRARSGEPLPVVPQAEVERLLPELTASTTWVRTADVAFPVVNGQPLIDADPLFALAEHARRQGRHEEAMALYLSIPRDSDRYARARRTVAWNILTQELDRPEQAVRLVNESLHADPFDGNGWQDWARVYGRTLGLPVQ
jgi:tetratricopeptide (TPR) repeat protein